MSIQNDPSSKKRLRFVALAVVLFGLTAFGDETEKRYFNELRRRSLHSLAEGHAIAKLKRTDLSPQRRVSLTIELSQTMIDHAGYVSSEQRDELWKRSISVIEEERPSHQGQSDDVLLQAQAARVTALQGLWLSDECELRPYDRPFAESAKHKLQEAIARLSEVEQQLSNSGRDTTKPAPKGTASSADLRDQASHTRFQLAYVRLKLAALLPTESNERLAMIIDSEKLFRSLISAGDEETSFRSKIGLATCSRLKGDDSRWTEMMKSLSAPSSPVNEELMDEVTAEHARGLLVKSRSADAAELIAQARSKRKRLSGELWLLQVRALASMRDIALSKNDEGLANQLRDHAETTLLRCDEQVGGYWSRRCHEVWETVQTAEKYGPELDAAMQSARSEFLAGRIGEALSGYADAAQMAFRNGHHDLAFDLTFTRASILLSARRYEEAAEEFNTLATKNPQHTKSATAHLNSVYALGRLYEDKRSQPRREAYAQRLDQHIEMFPDGASVHEARYLKARLEEQRLQASTALPLYLQVAEGHPVAKEAHAGAARCFESLLIRMKERQLDTDEFEKDAITQLSQFVERRDGEAMTTGSPADCEVSLHLAAILLLQKNPDFPYAEKLLASIQNAEPKSVANQTRSVTSNDDESVDSKPVNSNADSERWNRLRQRSTALRVVALAGGGQPQQAARVIESLSNPTIRELIAIAERMAPFITASDPERRVQYVALQLKILSQISARRSELSGTEQNQLDRWQAQAFLASGQLDKAVQLYRDISDQSQKDAARQREIALSLESFDRDDCQKLAKLCWRRAEAASKPGSLDWLTARYGVINTCVRIGEKQEAQKLFVLTKLLYPDLGGDEMKKRFMKLEPSLSEASPK